MTDVLVARDRFRHRHRCPSRLFLQSLVEPPQEFSSRMRVVFPGVLTVQDDGNHGILPARQHRLRRFLNLVDEIVGRVLRRHSPNIRTRSVRERVVAEEQIHPRIPILRSDKSCRAGAPDLEIIVQHYAHK